MTLKTLCDEKDINDYGMALRGFRGPFNAAGRDSRPRRRHIDEPLLVKLLLSGVRVRTAGSIPVYWDQGVVIGFAGLGSRFRIQDSKFKIQDSRLLPSVVSSPCSQGSVQ